MKQLEPLLFLVFFTFNTSSQEVLFEASNMDVKDNGNIILGYNSKTNIPIENVIIESKNTKYIKDKNIIIFSGKVIFTDNKNNIIITGANGYLSQFFCKDLCKNYNLILWDIKFDKKFSDEIKKLSEK